MGVSFDKIYYESDTYLLGKQLVEVGLSDKVCFSETGWFRLVQSDRRRSLDQKLLLRADGTSVYMTQDLGTSVSRFEESAFDIHIYVVGNEQNYHFQVLKVLFKNWATLWQTNLVHLSYGMVELPEGKMKSRKAPLWMLTI